MAIFTAWQRNNNMLHMQSIECFYTFKSFLLKYKEPKSTSEGGKMTSNKYEQAIFAGGCFWCMVKPFDQWPGIKKVVSGYTGGVLPNPTYEEVCLGTTGHYEAVQITYDPSIISYEQLLDIFWQQIDPTDPGGQFYDRGNPTRPQSFI